MKESYLTKKIRVKLKETYGGIWVKIPGGPFMVSGFPDLVGCVDGFFIGIEVKLPGKEKTLTERQTFVLDELREKGKALAFMATSVDEAVKIVGEYLLSH